MALYLQRGQRVDLTRSNPGLRKIKVGIGWDSIKTRQNRLIGRLFNKEKEYIECDTSIVMLGQGEGVKKQSIVINSDNHMSGNSGINYFSDNPITEEASDDEVIIMDLKEVPYHIQKLMVVVNIQTNTERKHFGLIKNTYIRISNLLNQEEIIYFHIPEECNGMSGMIIGEIYRHGNEWKFAATGKGLTGSGIEELVKSYSN